MGGAAVFGGMQGIEDEVERWAPLYHRNLGMTAKPSLQKVGFAEPR